MHRKGIVSLLCRCLHRKNHDLLVLVVSFLRKLSIFQENINQMIENKIVENLVEIMETANIELIKLILRLMFNLSFNQTLRSAMMIADLPRKLVPLLGSDLLILILLLLLWFKAIRLYELLPFDYFITSVQRRNTEV